MYNLIKNDFRWFFTSISEISRTILCFFHRHGDCTKKKQIIIKVQQWCMVRKNFHDQKDLFYLRFSRTETDQTIMVDDGHEFCIMTNKLLIKLYWLK